MCENNMQFPDREPVGLLIWGVQRPIRFCVLPNKSLSQGQVWTRVLLQSRVSIEVLVVGIAHLFCWLQVWTNEPTLDLRCDIWSIWNNHSCKCAHSGSSIRNIKRVQLHGRWVVFVLPLSWQAAEVSVEMIEAVGHDYLPGYFGAFDEHLSVHF